MAVHMTNRVFPQTWPCYCDSQCFWCPQVSLPPLVAFGVVCSGPFGVGKHVAFLSVSEKTPYAPTCSVTLPIAWVRLVLLSSVARFSSHVALGLCESVPGTLGSHRMSKRRTALFDTHPHAATGHGHLVRRWSWTDASQLETNPWMPAVPSCSRAGAFRALITHIQLTNGPGFAM